MRPQLLYLVHVYSLLGEHVVLHERKQVQTVPPGQGFQPQTSQLWAKLATHYMVIGELQIGIHTVRFLAYLHIYVSEHKHVGECLKGHTYTAVVFVASILA